MTEHNPFLAEQGQLATEYLAMRKRAERAEQERDDAERRVREWHQRYDRRGDDLDAMRAERNKLGALLREFISVNCPNHSDHEGPFGDPSGCCAMCRAHLAVADLEAY